MESQGIDEVINIGKNFGIDDINLIKTGDRRDNKSITEENSLKVLIDERYKGNPSVGAYCQTCRRETYTCRILSTYTL